MDEGLCGVNYVGVLCFRVCGGGKLSKTHRGQKILLLYNSPEK